jgi:hypothetical protein
MQNGVKCNIFIDDPTLKPADPAESSLKYRATTEFRRTLISSTKF